MKAMILAAGLGTRLRPLTQKIPKALIPVGNRPLIDRDILYLKDFGVNEIVVNAHHHSRQVAGHIQGETDFGIPIRLRVEPEILGTGGGIKNVRDFWNKDPFIVMNVDILTNIGLEEALETHRNSGNLATLILHDDPCFNKISIDRNLRILDIPPGYPPGKTGRFAFTGIHIMDPEILEHIPEEEFSDIVDCYRRLIGSGAPLGAHISRGHDWRDVGTVESYVLANREALGSHSFLVAPGCRKHPSVRLRDWAVIGPRTTLEEDVEIRRSILWDRVRVKKGRRVMDSVVTSSMVVEHDLTETLF
jgi:mannose-1-phosphate guanylyltransferase